MTTKEKAAIKLILLITYVASKLAGPWLRVFVKHKFVATGPVCGDQVFQREATRAEELKHFTRLADLKWISADPIDHISPRRHSAGRTPESLQGSAARGALQDFRPMHPDKTACGQE